MLNKSRKNIMEKPNEEKPKIEARDTEKRKEEEEIMHIEAILKFLNPRLTLLAIGGAFIGGILGGLAGVIIGIIIGTFIAIRFGGV